jgi:hypothetical protein
MRHMKRIFIISFLLAVSSLTAAGQVTNSGNLKLAPGAAITFFGNLTNNGSLTDSGTVVTLAGAAMQTIDGSSVTTFNNLTLNNASAIGITLNQAMNVRGTLVLTDGYLVTTTTNILGLTATATVSGASSNSFVSGPVFKTGNQAFVFPVGKNVVYAPIAISAPALVTDRFTAQYFQASPNGLYNVNNREAGLDHVSQCEYWLLDRTTGASDVTVNLSWAARSCGVTSPADLRVTRWDGTQWTNKGNGGTTGTLAAGTIVSSPAVTGFGPFTLGSVSSNNPLPVELIDFTASCQEGKAVLQWRTASELNNDYFTIESSKDALEWTVTDLIDGAGNSTALLTYSYADLSDSGKDLYYRLTQTDMDGNFTVFDRIIFLKTCDNEASENTVTVYPNPAKNKITVLTNEDVTAIAVFNSAGMKVGIIVVDLADRSVDFSDVPEGIYFLEITTPSKAFNQRVVINGR